MSKFYFNRFKVWLSFRSFRFYYYNSKCSSFIRISIGWLKITIYKRNDIAEYKKKEKFDPFAEGALKELIVPKEFINEFLDEE